MNTDETAAGDDSTATAPRTPSASTTPQHTAAPQQIAAPQQVAAPLTPPRSRHATPTTLRRRLLVEVAVVLSVSLGASAMYSILSIIERMTRHVALNQQTSSLNTAATPDRPWLSLLYQLAELFTLVAPVALALYLLASVARPREGWRGCMGLHRVPGRRDWVWGFAIFAGIGVPGLGLYLGARELGLNTTVQAANLGEHWWTIPALVLAALGNGLLEEVVMVGYLFTRFRQAGQKPWVGLLVSALIRGSYHLYQGFGGFVGNVVMGLVFGVFFLKTKRVWPLVLAHFLLDVASFVGYSLLAGKVSWL